MEVNLEWVTPDAEKHIARMARGSNPPNQESDEWAGLFSYCLGRDDKHWSILQMANMCVGIETSLAIAAQFKRHWSLACHGPEDLQETSFRYMSPTDYDWGYQPIELRAQAAKNRQASGGELAEGKRKTAEGIVREAIDEVDYAYRSLIGLGVARECARFILPTATTTRFFVNGTARSWATYFIQRLSPHAQLEHQALALALYALFEAHHPTVCRILFRRVHTRVELVNKSAERIAELEARIAELETRQADARTAA